MAISNGPNLGILVDGAIGEVHYDALMQQWRAIDALVQSRVKSAVINTPPVSPADGDCYVVPSGATGVWSGNTNKIARYSSKQTAWEYYTPKNGWAVQVESASPGFLKFNGTAWVDPIAEWWNSVTDINGKNIGATTAGTGQFTTLTTTPASGTVLVGQDASRGTVPARLQVNDSRMSITSAANGIMGGLRPISSARNAIAIEADPDNVAASSDVSVWVDSAQVALFNSTGFTLDGNAKLSGSSPYISQSTGDGSDTRRIQLAGGGAPLTSRGAYINLHGNEHESYAGYCDLLAGDTASGGGVRFYTGASSLKAEFPRDGGFLLGGDNLYNIGSSSRRIKDIYLANAPTVSSDQALKTPRRDFLDAELDAIDACELGLFQWLDAVVDKGDAARLHAGVIAQQVVEAFASRGLDPYHYGPICRDPIFEDRLVEERKVVRKRQVVRTVPSEDRRIEIIDGVPTEIVEVKHVEEPVFEMRPVVRQDGTPVMETVRVLQDDGTPLLDEAGQPVTAERPVLHQCPAMEDYDDIERVTEQVQTGWRYSIRYDELLIMLVAAERRKNSRLAERITALEGV